jgi:YegS/Rv2252/BmrU family lipid kinase
MRDWNLIAGWLNHFKFKYHPVFTEYPGHAIQLTRGLVEKGYKRIIAVGGDGTMNEVVNGVFLQKRFKTTEVSLGMITVGTGNDWGRMFGIPRDYKKAVEVLLQNRTFIQDAGMVKYKRNGASENRYFVNIAGLGFDAEVVRKTNRLKEKGKGGPLLYLINIFTSLVNYKFVNALISVDGTDLEHEILSMNVGICKYNGGGMISVPGAVPDDGLFDLTVINRMSRPNIIWSLRRLYDGTINEHPRVDSFTGRSIRVESADRIMLETDGESLGHTPLEFSILPKSVKVIAGFPGHQKAPPMETSNRLGQYFPVT